MAADNALSGITDRLDKLATLSAKASIALDAFVNTLERSITSLGKQMTQFVALANPAVVMRFNMALQNAMSAIGRIFIPVLEKLGSVIQQIGNAIESLDPTTKKLIAGLAGGAGLLAAFAAVTKGISILAAIFTGGWLGILIKVSMIFLAIFSSMSEGKEITKAFDGVLKAVGSVIQVLAHVFAVVFVPIIKLVISVIRSAVELIAIVIRKLASMLGIDIPDFNPNAKTAQAVRQSQMTDIRGIANRAYTQTFGGAASNVQDNILAESKLQTKLLESIDKKFSNKGLTGEQRAGEFVTSPVRASQREAFSFGRNTVRGIQNFNSYLLDRMRRIFGG